MNRIPSSTASWLGVAMVVAAGTALALSPRLRRRLLSIGAPLSAPMGQASKELYSRMEDASHGRRLAALQQVSHTIDSATTQWESSVTVSKVASALGREPQLRGKAIGVRVIGGILHLEGEVRTEQERALAGEIARRVSGAELVANGLRLSPAAAA